MESEQLTNGSSGNSDEMVEPKLKPHPGKIVWRNVVLMSMLHIVSLFTLTRLHTAQPLSLVWTFLCHVASCIGITAGAHRLWTHRGYKAKLPLRILLACFNSMAFQMSILFWVRDHRVHHKFSETDADPHNAKRGFFFSHIGWLLMRKHPDVIRQGKGIDLSDLYEDPVVMFQHKYYVPCLIICCFVLPTVVPLLWGESFLMSYMLCLLRYCATLNCTWLINSAAHMWGSRPYDKNINPVDNLALVALAIGDGFHNYHHVFPFDYANSEFGVKFNLTTAFIDVMAFFGLVTDRRTVSPDMIKARKKRTGEAGF